MAAKFRPMRAYILVRIEVQNSEVSNMSNVVITQKANTKSSARQHGHLTNVEARPGAEEE
jgi:hypothetical protein